jgi:hypothetical protein
VAVIMNQGNTPNHTGLFQGNASTFPNGTPSNLTIPVVAASYFDGIALSRAGSTRTVSVDPPVTVIQAKMLAELPGRGEAMVMAGAHLSSVPEGPGIQTKAQSAPRCSKPRCRWRR